jgi:hypothetical protein
MTTQHINTRGKHPFIQRDSNPRSQQPSGRRPTSYTVRPPGSASNNDVLQYVNLIRSRSTTWQYCPNLPRDALVKVTLVTRPLLAPDAQRFVQVRTWRVLEYYVAYKLFAAACESYNVACSDKEAPSQVTVPADNNISGHRKCNKCSSSGRAAEITTVPISTRATAG